MIVSCHVPKTAGTTFGMLLRNAFGRRLCEDYGDRVAWTGPEAEEWRRRRGLPPQLRHRWRRGRVRVVHGHFYASKYATRFGTADMVAFVRDPVTRVVSNYRYLLANPTIAHPLVAEFHARKPELHEWIEWPWARNQQVAILDVPLERFALIGLTERFVASVELFDAMFGTSLADAGADLHLNAGAAEPAVDPETAARVAALNELDMHLYRRAVARFATAYEPVGRG